MWRLRVLALALVSAAAPAPPGGPDVRAFRLSSPIPGHVLRAARADSVRANQKLKLVRNTLMLSTKTCWRSSSACREIGFHPELVAQARAVMGGDGREPLFLKTVQVISRPPGSCQKLHTDLDMWTPECAGSRSAAVWLLTETGGVDSLPSSPIHAFSGTSALNMSADHFLAERGCGTIPSGWERCDRVDSAPASCSPAAVLRDAQRRWPGAHLELASGPVRAMHGFAWRGQTWHFTRDNEYDRTSVLLQYGTEQCMRSLRDLRPPVDVRARFRGPDWLPFARVHDEGAARGPQARPQFVLPHVLDRLFLDAADAGPRPPGLQYSRREPTWVLAAKAEPHNAGILVASLADFAPPDKPSWVSGGVHVHNWRQIVSTPHLSMLRAHVSKWARGKFVCVLCVCSLSISLSLSLSLSLSATTVCSHCQLSLPPPRHKAARWLTPPTLRPLTSFASCSKVPSITHSL
jgi:hypothetical protein